MKTAEEIFDEHYANSRKVDGISAILLDSKKCIIDAMEEYHNQFTKPQSDVKIAEKIVFAKGEVGFIVMKKFGGILMPITDEKELESIGKIISQSSAKEFTAEQMIEFLEKRLVARNIYPSDKWLKETLNEYRRWK